MIAQTCRKAEEKLNIFKKINNAMKFIVKAIKKAIKNLIIFCLFEFLSLNTNSLFKIYAIQIATI